MGLNLFRLLAVYLKPVIPALAENAEQFLNSVPDGWVNGLQALTSHTINEFKPLMTRVEAD